MAHQEEGWPLGLQPLNGRNGLVRNGHFSGSMSFNTYLTGSPSFSSDSSSDLDTESTGSFFHDKSITLGSLIGVSSILQFSRRSVRARKVEVSKDQKTHKSKTWFFSLCSRTSTDAENGTHITPSLGQFLAVERRAANAPAIFGPDEIEFAQPVSEQNTLFVNGRVAPPPPSSSSWFDSDIERREKRGLINGNGCPVMFSCICGQSFL